MFKMNIVDRFHLSVRGNDKLLLLLLTKCLQGVAINIWEQMLDEQTTTALDVLAEEADESALNYDGIFTTVMQHYLKEVQGLKFIGNAAICFLPGSNKKPATKTPAKFFRRRATILGFITGEYLRFKLSAQRGCVSGLCSRLARKIRRDQRRSHDRHEKAHFCLLRLSQG